MNSADAEAVVLQFNDCINRRDLEGLPDLMAAGHTFIDTANNRVVGKGAACESISTSRVNPPA